MGDTKPLVDTPAPKRTIERVREWEHKPAQEGDPYCYRSRKPVYTPPSKAPGDCHGCGVNDWKSKGVVERVKEDKKIIRRDIDPTKA